MRSVELHPAVAHLSPEELGRLIAAYISGTKVAVLLKEFNINCVPNQFRNVLPPQVLDRSCEICGGPMIQELSRRGSSYLRTFNPSCLACKHEESPNCRCGHCEAERYQRIQDENARMRERIRDALCAERNQLGADNTPKSLDSLSLSQAVAFLAFVRCSPLDESGLYRPPIESSVPFAPTEAWGRKLLASLQNAGLIEVSEQSDLSAISLENGEVVYCPLEVLWASTIGDAQNLVEQIEIAGLRENWPEHWHNEASALWLELAMAECHEFYDYCACQRGVKGHSELAVQTLLKNLLRDFSVAQCYRIIWNGAQKTADFMVREKPGYGRAASYMIGACQRWADYARTAGWNVFPFKRNFDLPRSMMSYVLLDVILRIGECGFNEVVASRVV